MPVWRMTGAGLAKAWPLCALQTSNRLLRWMGEIGVAAAEVMGEDCAGGVRRGEGTRPRRPLAGRCGGAAARDNAPDPIAAEFQLATHRPNADEKRSPGYSARATSSASARGDAPLLSPSLFRLAALASAAVWVALIE